MASYRTQHRRVETARGKADRCLHRNAIHCQSMTFNWAWIHGEDRNDVYSYVPLCKSCHGRYDGTYFKTGTRHPNAKLTEEIVLACRERHYEGNETQKALAREFGVSNNTMNMAIRGRTWEQRIAA
jgi:hypothetical protein